MLPKARRGIHARLALSLRPSGESTGITGRIGYFLQHSRG